MQEKDKEILEKIKNKALNTAKGISDDVKSRLYVALYNKGMSNGTINRRLLLVGFKEWERVGIDKVIADFAEMNDLQGLTTDNILSVLTAKRGYREHFYSYMAARGMCRITCIKRFEPTSAWLPWEHCGIRSIVEQVESEY